MTPLRERLRAIDPHDVDQHDDMLAICDAADVLDALVALRPELQRLSDARDQLGIYAPPTPWLRDLLALIDRVER